MKLKLILLSIIALCVSTCTPAFAQEASPWSLGAYYSFGQRDYAAVTSNKIRTLENVLNLRFNLDVNGFAGVATKGATLVGGSLTASAELAKGVFGFIGIGADGDIMELRNISLGIHAGIRIPLTAPAPETMTKKISVLSCMKGE